jgi:two-component system, cell cycle response regulator DivK
MVKILLVEDNQDSREGLARRLQRRGYEVIQAGDGQQGLSLARLAGPDLVLMDMNLPIVDGWEATRQLKEATATRDLPIIALTAHALSSDRIKTLEAGCTDHHPKPVDLPRLLAQIEAALKSAPAHQISAASDSP